MNQIADRLRQLRGEQTQAEFARQLNMQRPQLANYETGKNVPSADFVYKVCEQTGASADWLLGLSDKSSPSIVTHGSNSSVVDGSHNSVTLGEGWQCSKCPYKKKLKIIEKVFSK